MNFVIGLPKIRRGFDVIWVIVHPLTKSSHILPIHVNSPLDKLAKLYINEIMKLHDIPVGIVFDRSPRFIS